MVEIDSTNWLRKLEILSLSINIFGWPSIGLFLAIVLWYILIPTSNNPYIIYLGISLILFLGITCDTRYGFVGIFFMQPFKNYLKHSETKDDEFYALASLASTFGIIVLFYGILQIIQD